MSGPYRYRGAPSVTDLVERNDEWQVTERRYLSEASMAKLDENDNDGDGRREVGTKRNELLAG